MANDRAISAFHFSIFCFHGHLIKGLCHLGISNPTGFQIGGTRDSVPFNHDRATLRPRELKMLNRRYVVKLLLSLMLWKRTLEQRRSLRVCRRIFNLILLMTTSSCRKASMGRYNI
ncbi:uncharacterized protein LOC131227673 isoform X2 [Magnolia sinica]|uniref:uncharacterized protein LOC131227673 isoform X2 n=1 Tax=Magnolia sinica TaxID=86752 RepID=UPI0026580253|nr:uncharacterized protein LOC131227673 isoform X2 [Magnolia sinica]